MSAAIGMMGTAARPSISQAAFKALKAVIPKEPHPYFIWPQAAKNQPVQMRFYTTRLARTATMYVPMYVGFLGWPFAAKELILATTGV